MTTEPQTLPDSQETPAAPAPGTEELDGRKLALRTITGLALLFTLAAVGAYFAKDSLTGAGQWFFANYGLLGLCVGTLATDIFGVPVPVDVYLAAAITADKPVLPVLIVACMTSVFSGSMSYCLGHVVERLPLLGRLIKRYENKGRAAFAKWGVTAVAIAAWTPLPFSIVCWFAGAFRMPYRRFALASLHRIPRIVLYYYVIALGWFAGT